MLPGMKDVKQSETNIRSLAFDRDFCSPEPDAENIHGPADLVCGKDRFRGHGVPLRRTYYLFARGAGNNRASVGG